MTKIDGVKITINDLSDRIKVVHEAYMNATFNSDEYGRLTYTGETDTEDHGIELRLQVVDGSWYLHSGDPSYDTDHRGYWGCAFLPVLDEDENGDHYAIESYTKKRCREISIDLLEDIAESYSQSLNHSLYCCTRIYKN